MMTDEEFDNYHEYCFNQWILKNEQLQKNYGVGTFDEYFFDQLDGVLRFKNDGQEKVAFRVTLIGSWSWNSETWMWAWANLSLTEDIRNKSIILKGIKETTGYDIFEIPKIECDEEITEGLVAFSIEYLNAKGMYKATSKNSYLYMAIMEEAK